MADGAKKTSKILVSLKEKKSPFIDNSSMCVFEVGVLTKEEQRGWMTEVSILKKKTGLF